MSEEKDLWEIVRQKISDSETNDEIEMPKITAEGNTVEEENETKQEIKKNPKQSSYVRSYVTLRVGLTGEVLRGGLT